jgi:hypothetical protein
MKFAYYTTFFNDITVSDRTFLFCIWLYYLLKSGSIDTENDYIYIITNEETSKHVTGSNLYKFIMQIVSNVNNKIKFINIDKPDSNIQESFVKYFPPIVDIMSMDKPDYILYCDIYNLITGNIREKFENNEEIPVAYVMFEKSITDDVNFSYIKDTEWYSNNKEIVDKLPGINTSLFCIKNGNNEIALLKSVFEHVASDHYGDAILNYTLYSHSQYINEKCYIELHPKLFYECVEINKLDSKKQISLLRNIDSELINETLLISLLCRIEKL